MLLSVLLAFAHAFDKTWCEPELKPHAPVGDADLVMVQLVTRHGARTPLHTTTRIDHVWKCNCTEYQLFYNSESHPVKVHVSHGDSVFLGDCHVGQLLDRGSDALFRLGRHLREVYVESLKFLPSRFAPHLVKFRSTNTHRTLHSAMALVGGLFPGRSLVTIHVADKFVDPWRRSSAICPNLKKNIEAVRTSDAYQKAFEKRIDALGQAAKAIGAKTKSAPDIVMAARCDGQKFSTPHDVFDKAALLKADQQQFVFKNESVFPLMFSFSAAEMTNEFIKRINGESQLRFIHWSVHDGNIFGFLGYLGTGSPKLPPYGSYIIVELWRGRQTNSLFLRFTFNGDVIPVPRLGNRTHVPFHEFASFVRATLPNLTTDCGFDAAKFQKGSVFGADP